MSQWAGIFIETDKIDLVSEQLKQLAGITTSTRGEFPFADLYSNVLLDDDRPTYLIVAQTQPEWITVAHNALRNLEDWGKELSNHFQTRVILASAISTNMFYHFSLYEKGEMLREIEYCYLEDYTPINLGTKFEFENEQPGTKHEYDGEISFTFDSDSIEEYSKHFGLDVKPNFDIVKEWIILKKATAHRTIGDYLPVRKPWWKFW